MFLSQMKWEYVSGMCVCRAGATVAAINSYIYVMGGRTGHAESYNAPATLTSMECYDHQTDTWIYMEHMPTSRCDAAAVVL